MMQGSSGNMALALLLVAVVTSTACTGDRALPVDTDTIKAQIRDADVALLRAEEERDLAGAMQLIAPDAVFHPPGSPPIAGHEAIRHFYEDEWFKIPFIELSGEADTIVVASSGDLAFFDGRSRMVLEISGERKAVTGKYLGIWRKVSGQWLLAAISWSGNEDG